MGGFCKPEDERQSKTRKEQRERRKQANKKKI